MIFQETRQEKVQRIITKINELIKQKKRFTLDSSAIIPLAQETQNVLLDIIIPNRLFTITPTVFKELFGLRKLHPELNEVVKKIGDLDKIGEPDPNEVELRTKIYAQLIFLLPRKITHELLITDTNSYVAKAIAIFKKGEELLLKFKSEIEVWKHISTEVRGLHSLMDSIAETAQACLLARAKKLNIDLGNFPFDLFARAVKTEARLIDVEIKEILKNAKGNINVLQSQLAAYQRKTYQGDERHLAEVLLLRVENITEDYDQLFLMELSSRRAA